MALEPGTPDDELLADGQLGAAISNAIVRVQREYLGRGPTKARSTIRDSTIMVLMQDTLTKAERSLVAAGKREEVLRIRDSLQHTMKTDMVSAVERLTGRSVVAFMSAHHIDPDLSCEIFVLDEGVSEAEAAG